MRDEGSRPAAHAGSFYPADTATIRDFLDRAVAELPDPGMEHLAGAVLPHAGWVYSGAPAARACRLLARLGGEPETVVLFGAVHRIRMAEGPCLDWHSSWETPLGRVAVDREAAESLATAGIVAQAPLCHQGEHSLEVLVPMIQAFLPAAKILPLAMVPVPGAPEAGREVARHLQGLGRRALVVGSTDLTHYGPRFGLEPAGRGEEGLAWARANDRRFLDRLTAMQERELVPEALDRMNACGAGAAAATLGFARELGARRGFLVEHTDSHEAGGGAFFDGTYVGYGSVVFG